MTLLDYCESRRDELIDTTIALVRAESPSGDKAAVDRCGALLADRLRALGASVRLLTQPDRGDHLSAIFDGDGTPVLVLGHFDTVWDVGTLDRMPAMLRDGRLFGPGAFDMKAGIAIAMTAMAALRASGVPRPPVHMLWTSDEEIGSGTSRAAIEDAARQARAVLVLEPSLPGGAVKTSRKGCGEFTLTVDGVSAHAGIDPSRGTSAIHELAHQIRVLESLQDSSAGISVNVGVVHGGTRPNVVAGRATLVVDVRVPTAADGRRIETAIRGLQPGRANARLTVQGGFDRPPLERSPGVVRLFELARQSARALGRTLDEGGTGGGSDGSFTAALGVPTLDGLGAIGDGAHAENEHVVVSELAWRAALVADLLARVPEVK